jgi:hypothetical protein
MSTVVQLIEYLDLAENKLQELKNKNEENSELYKKLIRYRDDRYKLYKRMMERKTTWKQFGKAAIVENESLTTVGDEILMEIVNEKREEHKSEHSKYYNDMGLTPKLIEENYNRYKNILSKFKTTKELQTDVNGNKRFVYVTREVEVEKYKKRFEVPNDAKKKEEKKRTLDDLFKENSEENDSNNGTCENGDTQEEGMKSKYVPPSVRNGPSEELTKDLNRKLIVRNISRDIMEDDIAAIIMTCGKLYDVRIHRDRYTGESKGFAFVKCETHETAKKIIEKYDKTPLGCMIMRIDFAEDRKKR